MKDQDILAGMNILLLTSSFPEHRSSYNGIFVLELAKYLQQRGHRVTVVTQRRFEAPAEEEIDGIAVRRFAFSGWQRNIVWATQSRVPVRATLSFLFQMFRTARAVIARERIDVVHCYWVIPAGFVGVLLKWLLHVPVVATTPGSDLNLWANRPVVRLFIRFTLRRVDRLITLGGALKERALRLGIAPVKATSILGDGGMNLSLFRTTSSKQELRARCGIDPDCIAGLFVGRVAPPKRLDLLLQALALVRRVVPTFRLYIIGGDRRDGERMVGDSATSSDGMTFLGVKPHDEISPYLNAADLFVHASDHEGLPAGIMEAIAAGLPVVASRVGGIPELVIDGYNGYLADNRPEAFAEKIIRLCQDEPLRTLMSQQARQFGIDPLGSDVIMPQIEQIYREAIREKGIGK